MIPKIIHFVYGLEQDFGGKEFSFVHWAAIKSAAKMNPGFEVIYWYKYLPDNYYFEDIRNIVTLRQIEPPNEVFGNALCHVAHKADVVRLSILKEMGGVYLDMDTITVKGFNDLLSNQCVLGRESLDDNETGLCNAVMLAESNSKFIDVWIDSYKTFRSKGRDEFWGEHSVKMPLLLSKSLSDYVTLLPRECFFYPDWGRNGLKKMFYENHVFPDAYVHHLWESLSWGALLNTNEYNCSRLNTSYSNILVKVLSDEIELLRLTRSNWVRGEFKSNRAKLNLGSGSKRYINYVNCDLYTESGADLNFDISKAAWPIPDNSVTEVLLSSVLEHFFEYESFFKELYRVSRHGALIRIIVPYARHDWFLIDPTHIKAWHPESFSFLDKEISLDRYFAGDSMTPLALYWGVDFKLNGLQIRTESNQLQSDLSAIFKQDVDINLANKYLNNIAAEIHVELEVRK